MLLSNNTIGRIRLHFKSLESTNEFAMHILSKINPTDGMVVSTDFQSKGKGQFGRKWLGNAGQNLALTAILRPQSLQADHQFYLSKMVAVAVCESLSELRITNIGIKWPNDVVVDGEKICGILIQNSLKGKVIKYSAVGIGMNVLQNEFPGDFNRRPTSVALKSPYEDSFDVRYVESILFKKLDYMNMILRKAAYELIDEMYHFWLENRGKTIMFRVKEENVNRTGILTSVDEHGHLCIMGEEQNFKFAMGEITIVLNGEKSKAAI